MSKRKTIYNALPIVAAAYGEKFGVKVSVGGDTAYTDGKTIVVPNIPEDYPNKDVVWGYLAHEAAHVRFTDFSVNRRPGLHADLSNILEDCRIERAMINTYPGTAQTLNEVASYMAQAGHYQHVTREEHPASILEGFCLYWLQSQAVGQSCLQSYLDSAKVALEQTFPKGVVVRLNALLRKAVDAGSTAEAVALTEEIMKMLEEEKEKEEEKQQGDQNQSQQQQGDDGSSDGSGGGDSQGQKDQKNQSGGQDDSQQNADQSQGDQDGAGGQKGNSSGQDDSKGQSSNGKGSDTGETGEQPSSAQSGDDQQPGSTQSSNGDGAGDDATKKAAEVIRQVLEASGDDLLGDAHDSLKADLERSAEQTGNTNYRTVRNAQEAPKHPQGRQLVDSVKSTTAKIRSQLYGLVQASQRTGNRNRRAGKRLDTRNLHRVVAGDTRVFRSPVEKQKPNTAVHVLVDMSSSMKARVNSRGSSKSREQVAREASLALALALEPIPGVNPAVTYFCDNPQRPVFSVVKHGENVLNQSGRFLFGSCGTTPMAEAIWYAAFELSKTREDRKMMIVVTDGQPNEVAPTQAVIDLCHRSDIEMVGIGIETSAVSGLFDKNIVIDDATELQRTLFKLMERSLTANAA